MAQGDNIGTHGQSFFGYCGLGFEANGSYGVGVTPTAFTDIISDGFSGDNGTLYLNTIRSRGRYYGNAGPYEDEGSLEMVAAPENGLGYLLKAALGSESLTTDDPTSSGSDTVGHHEFTTSSLLPSLSVELGVGDIDAVRHVGAGVDTLELAHEAGEYLTATFEMIAKQPEMQGSLASATYSDLRPFVYHDGSFTLSGTDRSTDVQEASLSLENGLSGEHRAARTIQHIEVGERVIEDEVTLDFTDTTIWEQFLGAAAATSPQNSLLEGSLSATWTSPETIADTDVNYELTVDIPRAVMDTHDANLNENDQIAENVTYGILEDESVGYDISITLTNGMTTEY